MLSSSILLLFVASELASERDLVLPLSGLAIERPAARDIDYRVAASWRLADDGVSFEGGDTIDELRDGVVIATTWVSVGWFEVEDCLELLRIAPLDEAYEAPSLALFGGRVALRGGVYQGAEMRGRPVVAVCESPGDRKQLVVSRFGGAGKGRDVQLRELRASALVRAIHRAYRKEATRTTRPAEVADNRGTISARREVALPWSELSVELPADGNIWIAFGDAGFDRFERQAPALPDLALSVARFDGTDGSVTCDAAFELVGGARPRAAPMNLPTGWVMGRTASEHGHHSVTACHTFSWGVLLVAAVTSQKSFDFAPVAPLLQAIELGATKVTRASSKQPPTSFGSFAWGRSRARPSARFALGRPRGVHWDTRAATP